MDRREIDKETKATRSTKNILYWIVGIGVGLAIIAFVGGFFNHDTDIIPSSNTPGTVLSDTIPGDMSESDTLATDFGNK